MTDTYTAADGKTHRIADMPTAYLINAHKKAVAREERKHTTAHNFGETYDNPEREAEIDAMEAEIKRREADAAE